MQLTQSFSRITRIAIKAEFFPLSLSVYCEITDCVCFVRYSTEQARLGFLSPTAYEQKFYAGQLAA